MKLRPKKKQKKKRTKLGKAIRLILYLPVGLGLFLFACTVLSSLQWVEFEPHEASGVESPSFRKDVDQFLKAAEKNAYMQGVFLASQDGKVLHTQSVGEGVDVHSRLNVASLSKQFTAAAILKLEEQGKLSIQDFACKYAREFCTPKLSSIRIEHLLSHTSGLGRTANNPPGVFIYLWRGMTNPTLSIEGLLADLLPGNLEFEPGKKFLYSNTGYIALSRIIEVIEKKRYSVAMKDLIFDPNGLNETFSWDPHTPGIPPHLSIGESMWRWIPLFKNNIAVSYGGGSVISTASDLAKWGQAILNGKALKESSLKKLFSPRLDDYGLGWLIMSDQNLPGSKVYWHNGGTLGYFSEYWIFPKSKITVSFLSNTSFTTEENQEVLKQFKNMINGKKYSVPFHRRTWPKWFKAENEK